MRVVNPGAKAATVRIEGVDDAGASSNAVAFTLGAGAAHTLSFGQLEEGGAGLRGALGDGEGKWRLTVTSGQPIEVMSLLSSPEGYLTNLSTVRGGVVREAEETAAEVFAERISGPIVQGKCINCHVEGGMAGPGITRLQFVRRASNPNHEALNLGAFEEYIAQVDDGANVILNKIQGVGHGGGEQVRAGTPGFADMKRFVADRRFAEATVEFWWPAIMGSEVAEPPEDDGDADFEGLLLAANAQGAEVARLANGFRRGFQGRAAYNLKDLLVEIVLSQWFRADVVEDTHPVRRVALRDAGARRLLTPEELARKTAAVTGVQWGREIAGSVYANARRPSALTEDYRLLYGGIDSDGIIERARDVTSVMAGVARRHAAVVSCPVVMRDFYLLPDAERRLFAGIDRHLTPGRELSGTFEIEAGSYARPETLTLSGPLSAGPKTVRLTFENDLWDPPDNDRNIRLDRLVLRDSSGRSVVRREMETLEPSGDCNYAVGDHFALHCNGSVDVALEVPAAGHFEIEIVAWADQGGDELPRLSVFVESETGGSGGEAVRARIVELYDRLLGVQVTPHSPDVEAAYRLFVDVMVRGRDADEASFRGSDCYWSWREDFFFLEGILDDAIEWRENEHGGYYGYSDRANDFMDSVDWSDPHYAA